MSKENAIKESRTGAGADDAELDQAIDELRGVLKKGAKETGAAAGNAEPADAKVDALDDGTAAGAAFADFDGFGAAAAGEATVAGAEPRLDLILDIPIDVEIVLGTSRMPVAALMNLSEGSTIALDRKIGEPVEITVNGRVIGHGEITVLEDDDTRFGVRLLDIATRN